MCVWLQLQILRFEKDFWKEIELKSSMGEDIVNLQEFAEDVEKQVCAHSSVKLVS